MVYNVTAGTWLILKLLALWGHSSRIVRGQTARPQSCRARKAAYAAGRGDWMALRIPKVSLHVEAADEGDLGEVHGEALGLGLMLLLALDMMLGGDQGSGAMPGLMRYSFCAAAAAMLLCGALVDNRVHAVFRTYKPVVVAMALFVPGAFCGIAGGYIDPSMQTAFPLIGGICNGLSMGLFVFLWGISFGRLGLRDITLNSVIGVIGGIGAYVLLRTFLPESPWLHAVISLLQLAHLVLLRTRVTDRLPDPDMRENAYFSELKVKRGSLALVTFPAMFCMGLILGNIVMHAGVIMKPQTGLVGALLCIFLVLVGGALVLAVCTTVRRRDQSFGRAFRSMVPIIAVLMPPLALSVTPGLSFDNQLLLINFTIVASMAWAYLGSLAQGFRLSPVFLFGLGQGGLALGYVLAAPVNALLASTIAQNMPSNVLALVVSLIALAIASSLLPRREDIMAIVVHSFKPAEMWGADEEVEGAQTGGAQTARQAGAWEAGAERAGRRDDNAIPKSHGGTPYAQPTPLAAAGAVAETDEVRKGRFVRRCEYVADTYLLSRRETDVLFLLAKGRNVGYITQQLCISEGTAKTHVNHVYKKCGVHSRQELICLIDSFDA